MKLAVTKISTQKLKHNFMMLGVISLATVLFWIAFSVVNSYQESTVEQDVTELRKPLTPTLNIEVIEGLSNRINLSDEDTFNIYIKNESKTSRGIQNLSNNSPQSTQSQSNATPSGNLVSGPTDPLNESSVPTGSPSATTQ